MANVAAVIGRSLVASLLWLGTVTASGREESPLPPPVDVPEAEATRSSEMRPYRELVRIPAPAGDGSAGLSEVRFDMVPIGGATGSVRFRQGSPDGEPGRSESEGPRREVVLSPFWIGRTEVSWQEYHPFMLRLDLRDGGEPLPQDRWADAVSRPTPPYVPMDFGMGVEGYPAVGMTQLAARLYTKWLSMRTGRFYRLATEAEWEAACRAGGDGRFGFGDDPSRLGEHAWYRDNSDGAYHRLATHEPNAWGLFDMHGNVAEWVLDALEPYAEGPAEDPVAWPVVEYGRVVRGGSFRDPAERLRCAARRASEPSWKRRDPQIPKSIWYHTDAPFVGFRVVRPLVPPPPEEWPRYWEPDTEELRQLLEEQR